MSVKFSSFLNGGEIHVSDQVAGLRTIAGVTSNYRFDFPGTGIKDLNGNYLLKWLAGAGANTNFIQTTSASSTFAPIIAVDGSDTNISLNISAKGNGTINFPGNSAINVPHGTTAERPTGSLGGFRYNTTTNLPEYFDSNANAWTSIAAGGGGGVTSVVATLNETVVDNTDPNNPIIGIADNVVLPGNIAMTVPVGTTAERPAGAAGNLRFNGDTGFLEYYDPIDISWQSIAPVSASLTEVIGTNNQINVDNTNPTQPVLSLSPTLIFPGTVTIDNGNPLTFFDDTGIGYAAFKAPTGGYLGNIEYELPVNAPGTNGFVLSSTTAGILSWVAQTGGGTGNALTTNVHQAAHGFALGNALYNNGGTFAKAKADVATTAEFVGVVSNVIDADNFTMTLSGIMSTFAGLTPGGVYYLSDATAGLLTTVEPSTGAISKPVMNALSTTSGYISNMRGKIISPPLVLPTVVNQNTNSNAVINGGIYIINNGATLVTLTIPGTAIQGFQFTVVGSSSGGWKIQANTGQIINIGATASSSAGSVASSNRFDSVTIICTTANTNFVNMGAPQGALTVL